MLVGNTFFIIHPYNENKFKLLLENQLNKKGKEIDTQIIDQSIAAFLECKKDLDDIDISMMNTIIEQLNVKYEDYRNYSDEQVIGNPKDAVKAFLEVNAISV